MVIVREQEGWSPWLRVLFKSWKKKHEGDAPNPVLGSPTGVATGIRLSSSSSPSSSATSVVIVRVKSAISSELSAKSCIGERRVRKAGTNKTGSAHQRS